MSLVLTLQTALLDRLFGSGPVLRIGNGADAYTGVCTSNPGDTGSTADEVDYGGREQILASGWDAPANGQINNNAFTGVWIVTGPTTLTYWLLGDTSIVNSTHDFSTLLTPSVPVVLNDQIRFPTGGLTVQVSGLLTHSYANDQLNMLLRNLSPSVPTDYHWALSTTTPVADGTNFTEPSGNNYGRVSLARAAPFGSAVSGSPSTISNSSQAIVWPVPTGSWGTVTHWGAFDASTGGNLLLYGTLASATLLSEAHQPSFETGDLTLTME